MRWVQENELEPTFGTNGQKLSDWICVKSDSVKGFNDAFNTALEIVLELDGAFPFLPVRDVSRIQLANRIAGILKSSRKPDRKISDIFIAIMSARQFMSCSVSGSERRQPTFPRELE